MGRINPSTRQDLGGGVVFGTSKISRIYSLSSRISSAFIRIYPRLLSDPSRPTPRQPKTTFPKR